MLKFNSEKKKSLHVVKFKCIYIFNLVIQRSLAAVSKYYEGPVNIFGLCKPRSQLQPLNSAFLGEKTAVDNTETI